jgi:hypothetical protein
VLGVLDVFPFQIGVTPSPSGRNEVITHWFFRPDRP